MSYEGPKWRQCREHDVSMQFGCYYKSDFLENKKEKENNLEGLCNFTRIDGVGNINNIIINYVS